MIEKESAEKLEITDKIVLKKKSVYLFRIMITLVHLILIPCCILLLFGIFGQNPFHKIANSEIKYEATQNEENLDLDKVENGIHMQTGLIFDEGFQEVRAICTACHSAKLVTQNRATREGWKSMIVWMQETQGLWDLGPAEPIVLDYLSKNYAPQKTTRRENLDLTSIEL